MENNFNNDLPLEKTTHYKKFFSKINSDYITQSASSHLTLEDLASIINIKFKERTPIQNAELYEFFKSTNFHTVLSQDLEYGQITIQMLFYFISQYFEIQAFPKNEAAYYEGTKSDYLYLLLEGNVSLLKLQSTDVEYGVKDYYFYLFSLYETGASFILDKTIDANKEVFPILKKRDIPEMHKIFFIINIANLAHYGDTDAIKAYLEENKKPLTLYNFHEVLDDYVTIDEFKKDIPTKMNEIESFYFKIFTDNGRNKYKKAIKTFAFTVDSNVKPFEYFGNYNLGEVENRRKTTAIFEETSKVLVINKKLYSQGILNEKRQRKEREIEHIHQNSFFKLMRRHSFVKYFFNEMDIIELNKGECLYHEGDEIKYIYIIKEGKFELVLQNKSLLQIKSLIAYIKSLDSLFLNEKYNDVFQLQYSINEMMDLLKEKKNYSLYVTSKDVFGVFENKYNISMQYNIECLSDKGKVYRLEVDKLTRSDNEDSKLLQRGIQKESEKKIKYILERLLTIKNNVLMKIDNEFAKKTRIAEDNYYSQLTVINADKNSVKPLIHKINEIRLQKINTRSKSPPNKSIHKNSDVLIHSRLIQAEKRKNNYYVYNPLLSNSNDNKDDETKKNAVAYTSANQSRISSSKLNTSQEQKMINMLKKNFRKESNSSLSYQQFVNVNENAPINTQVNTEDVILPKIFPQKAYLNVLKKKPSNIKLVNKRNMQGNGRVNRISNSVSLLSHFDLYKNGLDLGDMFSYNYNQTPKSINYLAVRKFYDDIYFKKSINK